VRCSVLGAGGFIGRHLTESLRRAGHEVQTPSEYFGADLGHVFYCIGVTADFRTRPFDTMRAHVSLLAEVLERARFDSLVYLSSTRVYARCQSGREDQPITVDVADPSDLYNLSKLAGEALCRGRAKVARLSNVVGENPESQDFLYSLIRAARAGRIELQSDLSSEKDYVSIDDVVAALPGISLATDWLFNLGGGRNLSHREIVERLVALTGCEVVVRDQAPLHKFPAIDIGRARAQLDYNPSPVLELLPRLVESTR
jgi:nucleoside-diphosphate-sugar epimerase